jgi:hypothetical protein
LKVFRETNMQKNAANHDLKSGEKVTGPRVLLVGYNGANNTGSEARLLAKIGRAHV